MLTMNASALFVFALIAIANCDKLDLLISKLNTATTLETVLLSDQRSLNCNQTITEIKKFGSITRVDVTNTKIYGLNQNSRRVVDGHNQDNWQATNDNLWASDFSGNLTISGLFLDIDVVIHAGNDQWYGKLIAVSTGNPLIVNLRMTWIEEIKRLVVKELRFEPDLELFFEATFSEPNEFFSNCVVRNVQSAFDGSVERVIKRAIRKAWAKAALNFR